jgi:class 3 adenylate cyclase
LKRTGFDRPPVRFNTPKKILSQKDRIEGERREVTIMFCDMKGFTPLTESLGPDKTFSMMDELFEILIQKVNDYQGTVNELRGDGILAFFGAPIALEDAPQRAIRSALAIHREMIRYNERLRERFDIPEVKLRIGINTGPVVVGAMGNDLRVQFTAVGDTINMASRMESLAEPGTVCVTEETFRLAEGFFRFEALGERRVKGKRDPVRVYRVIAPSSRRTRFDVSAERGLAPFVDRIREMEFIMGLFERVKTGSGQALSIVSEAGMGKSRLLYEFRKAVTDQDVVFLEGKCLSYSGRVAYHPITDIVRTAFRIREDDGDAQVQDKVRSGLAVIGADRDATLPFLLELLSVSECAADRALMSPESRKERVLEALRRIVLKGAERRPIILAVEDLHWIDKSSEDALKDLMEHISGARVFLVLTCRPEYRFTWGANPYHSQLTLDRLTRSESLQIVRHMGGAETFDIKLEELICSKTDGIPLFIEEYMRSLQGLEIIEKRDDSYCLANRILDMAIPSTLQEIIMARVDALPEGARELIQIGAAIEREFGYPLIREVMGLSEKELASCLSDLKRAGLVYEIGIHPDSVYVFNHAVTQEVVYDSILENKKRGLHERIGRAVESLYRDSLESVYEILARHYTESADLEKGAEYCLLAAKKSERKASFPDAIAFGEKRVECLEQVSRINAPPRTGSRLPA